MSDFYHQVRDLMFANAEHCPVSNILDTIREICEDRSSSLNGLYPPGPKESDKWARIADTLTVAKLKIQQIELRGRK